MKTNLYSSHPIRCIITGPTECGKPCSPTSLSFNIINDYGKIHVYSPSLHQDSYQKKFNCFSTFMPIIIIRNISNEEEIDLVTSETVFDENSERYTLNQMYR